MARRRRYTGSEFTGNRYPNTLPAKDRKDVLTPSEKLRLAYQTGQMTNVKEAPLENWLDPTGPRRSNTPPTEVIGGFVVDYLTYLGSRVTYLGTDITIKEGALT